MITMDQRFNRSLVLLIFVLATHITTSLGNHHHIKLRHARHRNQHGEGYLPAAFILDDYTPESGRWAPWSAPSSCSRSCGGGVAFQKRRCLDVEYGNERCTGAKKKFFSCNVQPCPANSTDFRAEQCARYNVIPIKDVYYDWVPYTGGLNKCELNCMPRGERFVQRHNVRVTDGTLCDEEKYDICVEGKCVPVGCDLILGSDVREDKCRVCGGDGSSCVTQEGLLDMDDLEEGYNDILLIPSGATNIDVREVRSSNNYLAIRNSTGHYYLNGDWTVDSPRNFRFAGTIFHYKLEQQYFEATDIIHARGPTTEDLYIVLLLQRKNVGVRYEFSIPKPLIGPSDNDTYTWVTDDFSECSVSCGGGIKSRRVGCVTIKDKRPADDRLCDQQLEPPSTEACSTELCPPTWVHAEWGPCSQKCGPGGTKTREVYCEQTALGGNRTKIDDCHCPEELKPKENSTMACNEEIVCPKWHVDPWKACDHLCGEGKQTRRVTCYKKENGKIVVLDDSECEEERPEDEKDCELRPCEGLDWIVSEWSDCDDKCGLTHQTRKVKCATKDGEIQPDKQCDSSNKPEEVRECESPKPCEYEWHATQWSECSAICGVGIQTRSVFCSTTSKDTFRKVEDDKCDVAKKYNDTKECTGPEEECKDEWFAGPWGECSEPCGQGDMYREVFCLNNNEVSSTNCDNATLLSVMKSCPFKPCDKDGMMPVTVGDEFIPNGDEEDCEQYEDDAFVSRSPDFVNPKLEDDPLARTQAKMFASPDDEQDPDVDRDIMMGDDAFGSDRGSGSGDGPIDVGIDVTASENGGDNANEPDGVDRSSENVQFGTPRKNVLGQVASTENIEKWLSSEEWTTESLNTEFSTDSTLTIDSSISDEYGSSDSSTESSTEYSFTSPDSTVESGTEEFSNDPETPEYSESTSADVASSNDWTTPTESPMDLGSTTRDSTDPTDLTLSPDGNAQVSTEMWETSSTSSDGTIVTDSLDESGSSTTEETATVSPQSTDGTEITSSDVTETVVTESVENSESATGESTEASSTESVATSESTTAGSTETSSTESSTISGSTAAGSTETSSTESSTISGSTTAGSTEDTESTERVTTESVGITESTTVESTESRTDLMGSTDQSTEQSTVTTEKFTEATSEGSTSERGFTSESTVWDETTELSTTETEEDLDTTEQSHITDFWTSLDTVTNAIKKEQTRKCKVKKTKKPKTCKDTKFGCCEDGVTPAEGPFEKGCQTPETCEDTEFRCCPDGVSPAKGDDNEGCPSTRCAETLFGCCQDNVTVAEGNDFEGCETLCNESIFGCCPDGKTHAEGPDNLGCCNSTAYGCCPDGVTDASGPDGEGCEFTSTTTWDESSTISSTTYDTEYTDVTDQPESTISTDVTGYSESTTVFDITSEQPTTPECISTTYGCCPDKITKASGPNYIGCDIPCGNTAFGCCGDGITPAHGINREGCCLNTTYGCCPDNIREARGPNLYGCGCQYSSYGCCPDNTTAKGPNFTGCKCIHTAHGCCLDQLTPATGPNLEGCPCHTYQFGCCPDGVAVALGPRGQGCGCQYSPFKCCPDAVTPAQGPNYAGCTCETSKYGCCPDGVEEAQGENFEGCLKVPEVPGAACALMRERGSCHNYIVMYYFNVSYGGCTRFWYGGCEGNGNRFKTMNECEETCVQPKGRAACHLPKIEGPCKTEQPSWYYDVDKKRCGQFIYRGCLGNANKFKTRDECEELCVDSDDDICAQPKEPGPCEGNFTRWHFNAERQACEEFKYGGCKANKNNFQSRIACQQQCLPPGHSRAIRDLCELEKEPGPCPGSVLRWYYDAKHESCRQFVYGGCKGNGNKFRTRAACVQRCPVRDYCSQPRDEGSCTAKQARWFFDGPENRCMPFYYTGCGGNRNNFETNDACASECPPKIEKDICYLPAVLGECSNYTQRWFFDSYQQRCRLFWYGGCDGNGNNFNTDTECKNRCVPTITTVAPVQQFKTEFCLLPNDHGSCEENLAKWFFDSRTGVCSRFSYGGCGGNGNRFETLEECDNRCGNVLDPCSLPPVVGNCRGRFIKYYYDRRTDSCYEFTYGGCGGNRNSFSDKIACESKCQRTPIVASQPTTVALVTPGPPSITRTSSPTSNKCSQPMDRGPCQNDVTAYFYDSIARGCQAFTYGGCGGNDNRFQTEEQCERLCGRFQNQDSCNLRMDEGPCREAFVKYYFDVVTGRCQEFSYSGCDGNANRFSTLDECESICLRHEEISTDRKAPDQSDLEICREPVDKGSCGSGELKRFHYDPELRTCMSFIYTGCGGNRNRFKTFDSCIRSCSSLSTRPGFDNVIIPGDPCTAARDECASLRCLYGVEAFVDAQDCQRCRCSDPCRDYTCPIGTRCTITADTNSPTLLRYIPSCKSTLKPGICPRFANGTCAEECRSDIDCAEDLKCCPNGCGTSCWKPVSLEPVTPPPRIIPSGQVQRIPVTIDPPEESVLSGEEGDYIKMKCVAHGDPKPTIQWKKNSVVIDSSLSRHRVNDDGSLEIFGLERADGGKHVCAANSNSGPVVKIQYDLRITAPHDKPLTIVGKPRTSITVTLGSPTTLECFLIGWPRPTVGWWHEGRPIQNDDSRYQQQADNSLIIHRVAVRTLGEYSCEGINGIDKGASLYIIVKTTEPVYHIAPEDNAYVKYIIQSRDIPRVPPRVPEIETGAGRGPESPTYPPYVPEVIPVVPVTSISPVIDVHKVFIASIAVNIPKLEDTFHEGTKISIACNVEGYPIPRVEWSKDDVPIVTSDRIQISDLQRLTISSASATDSGIYKCVATNAYESKFDTITIKVEGLDPNCRDNPFFANCPLIVKGKFCQHEYYAKFCCRSCTEAGQISRHEVHRNDIRRKKRSIPPRTPVSGSDCRDNPFFANCPLIVQSKFCQYGYYAKFCCRSCEEAGQGSVHTTERNDRTIKHELNLAMIQSS